MGIHTPEFGWEKDRAAVEKNLRKHGINYPNMMDNDFAYWNSLSNRYWPTVYVIDRKGLVRHVYFGEIHSGSGAAEEVEGVIETLLEQTD